MRVSTNFEPRVVHATLDTSRSVDSPCIPAHSPTQTRRTSGVGARSVSAQRHTPSIPPLPNTSVSFPRPAYLDHSALRDLLVTETTSPTLSGPAPPRKVTPPASSIPSHGYAMSPSTDSDEDSSPSPPPPSKDAGTVPTPVIPEEQVTYPLPTRWSDQARSNSLSVSHDGREISHHGPNNSDKEHAANGRANHPVPPACGIYYFEVEIRCKEQKSHISIGFGSRNVKFSQLPGWEPNSWGYYGDDGHAYENGRPNVAYAQTFGFGDIIGCGIDFTTHKMFYTKNQNYLGPIFDDVGKDGVELYPVVGLRHPGDCARVNFGHEPFRFDIEDHVHQRRNATWVAIMKTPLDSTLLHRRYHKNAIKSLITITEPPSALTEDESKSVLNQLVLSYLVHHGYAKTARAFQKQQSSVSTVPESDVDMDCVTESDELDDFEGDIERRTGIVNSVTNGDIDTALEEIRKHYPAVLEAEDGLVLFKLRCRKLVELILETNEIKRRMSNGKEREESPADFSRPSNSRQILDDDGMNMDIDEDALSFTPPVYPPPIEQSKSDSPRPPSGTRFDSKPPTTSDFEAALTRAIEYGQNFNNDYKLEKRPELRQMFEQASSVIAWHNPLEAGGDTAEVAGHEARIALANEVNEAILKSQGRPVRPTLEMVYRHTAACMTQLGVTGVGSAVFADMPREFLET